MFAVITDLYIAATNRNLRRLISGAVRIFHPRSVTQLTLRMPVVTRCRAGQVLVAYWAVLILLLLLLLKGSWSLKMSFKTVLTNLSVCLFFIFSRSVYS